jgi:hypothetical protein
MKWSIVEHTSPRARQHGRALIAATMERYWRVARVICSINLAITPSAAMFSI